MKKAITILLALVMVLSLAACGGGSAPTNTPAPTEAPATPEPTETPFEDLLVSTEWKAVLDYSAYFVERTFIFASDGSGSMLNGGGGSGYDFTWSSNSNGVRVKYEFSSLGSSNTYYYNLKRIDTEKTTKLIDEERGLVLFQDNTYDDALNATITERINSTEELDWNTARKLKNSNEAQYNQEYNGKLFKWTAIVSEIGPRYCEMSLEGNRINAILVYLSNSDLASINKGDTITVIGRFSYERLFDAFIVKSET